MNPQLAERRRSTPRKTASNFKQGTYNPRNPGKYLGDPSKIRYMSSWELEMHKFLDMNENVIMWASEEIAIPYLKPTDGKVHKYYPDYYVKYMTSSGEIKEEIIEVKPLAQTKAPHGNSKHKLYEQLTFAVNAAKWQACQAFCKQRNMTFRIVTERSIFK